jgi:hypothetical protein
MAELLDYDDFTGVMSVMEKDGDKLHVNQVQDVEPLLDANQREIASATTNFKGDLHKVASIPLIIIEQWYKELGDNPLDKRNRKWLIAKLNSNEFIKLRTKHGRV